MQFVRVDGHIALAEGKETNERRLVHSARLRFYGLEQAGGWEDWARASKRYYERKGGK